MAKMKQRRIAVNCWVLRNRQLDGIGNFTVQAMGHVIKNHPEQHFDLLVDKKFENKYFDYPNVTLHRIFPALRHPVLYVFFLEVVLPVLLKKIKTSLVVSMDGFLSLASSVKQLPVIYDLNFEHYPENLPLRNRVYYRFFFPRFTHKATHIVTISEYSKMDIVNTYHVPEKKIDNISCGISSYFSPCTESEKKQTKEKYTGGNEYFFFAGTMHPRKNIPSLIKAFTEFKKSNTNDLKLVLAGHIMWDDNTIKGLLENNPYKNDIILTGRVNNDELRLLLGSAWCLAFVPVFEGFGLPIVEAWQCGIPVICSNVTSMPEVAGDAAITVDPFNIEEIASAMKKMTDVSTRARYIALGQERKDIFSWERTASLFWDSIQRTLQIN
jgi:glycosyltransferase involved in cell wall biosynthesis